MHEKLLKIGAEARLKVEGSHLFKERIKKGYRIHEIDLPLRKQRTQREASLIQKAARAQIHVPRVYNVSKELMQIEMDFLQGNLIDRVINLQNSKKLGEEIAKLHNANIIHGDLTTSNIIVNKEKIYFIDFGLGEFSDSIEKKGVDLRVLKEAIRANHPKQADKLISAVLQSYKKHAAQSKDILKRLEQIEKRGRYKER